MVSLKVMSFSVYVYTPARVRLEKRLEVCLCSEEFLWYSTVGNITALGKSMLMVNSNQACSFTLRKRS